MNTQHAVTANRVVGGLLNFCIFNKKTVTSDKNVTQKSATGYPAGRWCSLNEKQNIWISY